jgi:hypothetical protein
MWGMRKRGRRRKRREKIKSKHLIQIETVDLEHQ